MKKKWVLLFLLTCFLIALLYFDITQYMSLEYLKKHQDLLRDHYKAHPTQSIALFCGVYILVTSLCIPGANFLTLLGGAVFGLWTGFLLASFSSAIGATIAFFGSRWLLRDYITKKYSRYIKPFNKGVEKNGPFYIFMLRMTPIVPFFATNLVMGITTLRPWIFYCFTQLGMIAGTLVYTNAGTEIGSAHGLRDIISAKIFLSFVALGVIPLFFRKFKFMKGLEEEL